MSDDRRFIQDQLKSDIDVMLQEAKVPAAARRGLAFLFPKIEEVLKTYIHTGSTDFTHRHQMRRLSIKDFAPAYFRINPQRATWSRSEIEQILSHAQPNVGLKLIEQRLEATDEENRPRLRRLLLMELDVFFRDRPITEAWLSALIDASPFYIAAGDVTPGLLSEDNSHRLRRIIYQGLKSLTAEARTELLLNVIPIANDISILCDVVRLIAGDIRPDEREEGRRTEITLGEGEDLVREVLLARARQYATSDRIWSQASPDRILWFWWGAITSDEVGQFTNNTLSTDTGTRTLLKIPIQIVRSSVGNYEAVLPYWSKIIDIQRLAEIAIGWLRDPNRSDEDRLLAQRYLGAYERADRR